MKAQRWRIERATDRDLSDVVSCLAAAFEPYRSDYTTGAFNDTVPTIDGCAQRLREMTILVARDADGNAVGTIACQAASPGEGHLRGMAVIPTRQGQGIAEALLQAAEKELRDADCRRLTLDTTRYLERAIRFYQRNGYVATGHVGDFFGMPLLEFEKYL